MGRAKNTLIREDMQGFIEHQKAKAEERVSRWNDKRRDFDYRHPFLSILIIASIMAFPIITAVAIISRGR